ncbi:hypothetical protein Ddye_001825 [Dipteronia dyeriana]|uniref:Uncharacterized protein n=1 Tax=Dipteronia dyeriana TaxID=168575 RepID=A0AAE0CTV4_9ROSI|nr:hypothetical protein Ddye_001825 [Dipteronia dyeriana]
MYDVGIPFIVVKYHIFNAFCETVGQYGPAVKSLTYHEVRVPLLKSEVDFTHENLKRGSVFVEFVDASEYAKTEDIFKLKRMKQPFERAIMINNYINSRTGVVNLLMKYTNMKELLRLVKTRFATAFIALSRIHSQKANLIRMFISDKWVKEARVKKFMAKEVIARSFGGNEIDEVANGLYTCIERLVPNVETRCAIDLKLSKYKKVEGLFGSPMCVRVRGKKSSDEDNLTWNDVAPAAGVGESSYRFRAREAFLSRVPQVRPTNQLLDEEESEEEIEGPDEGEQLQQEELQEGIGEDDLEFNFDV